MNLLRIGLNAAFGLIAICFMFAVVCLVAVFGLLTNAFWEISYKKGSE